MTKFKNYLSLIKFSHTIFAMPFAMIGFFVGCFYNFWSDYQMQQRVWNLNMTVGWGMGNPANQG